MENLQPKTQRIFALDTLREIMMLLGIVIHTAFLISLISYEIFVRNSFIGLLLNGRKYEPQLLNKMKTVLIKTA